MHLIDFHCDTFYRISKQPSPIGLGENELHIDLVKLRKGQSMAQCFAIFIDMKEEAELGKTPYETYQEVLSIYQHELSLYPELTAKIDTFSDLLDNQKKNRISAILTVEEGGVLEGQFSRLASLYQDGVRLITLTWNYPNEIGYPNTGFTYQKNGLTPFGHQVVEEMNRLGMLIDVSHLSDQGFEDVLKLSKKPFIASHSNARSVHFHSRNLTDEMIRALADHGGLMGLNFCNAFLGPDKISRIADMVKHIEHIRNVGGIDVIGLGTDFDGIECPLEIEDFGQMGKLINALERAGFKGAEIDKITYQNGLRLMKDVLK